MQCSSSSDHPISWATLPTRPKANSQRPPGKRRGAPPVGARKRAGTGARPYILWWFISPFGLDVRYYQGYTYCMKTAISIPDPIFKLADELARRLDMSRSELYARAVDAYILSHRYEAVTEALNAVYATEDSALDPTTARLQFASLPKDEW